MQATKTYAGKILHLSTGLGLLFRIELHCCSGMADCYCEVTASLEEVHVEEAAAAQGAKEEGGGWTALALRNR